MKKTAVFVGSFDPFTLGHYDLALRASRLVDRLYVCVAQNTNKRTMFAEADRLNIVATALKDVPNIQVVLSDGLLADFARSVEATIIVRGLRTYMDFEHEKALMEIYKQQYPQLECLYLIASARYSHLSSTAVRELIELGADLHGFVPNSTISLIADITK